MCFVGANGGVPNPAQKVIESFLGEGTAFTAKTGGAMEEGEESTEF